MVDIRERIYAGILGKAIGVRLGAPIESINWTQDLIEKSFGNITGYIKDSSRFAADDDINGPIFFSRALVDYSFPLTAEKIGWTWLNYTREQEGMFWWGGIGVSTEHTAYNNLKKGILPPKSGSSLLNGKSISEQVGGQIFIDSWGLINLAYPEKAMRDARIAASVSHDGEGLVGAQFISACIALAINYDDTEELVLNALELINSESQYYKIMMDIYLYYKSYPKDFRSALKYVIENYGYDKFDGDCHIIPNSCLVLIGLLYSKNRFDRAIEITCMCGWDTDSNAGVVGTIMGVMNGLDGIDWKYREPINDMVICSSMSPDLNVVDLLDFSEMLYSLRNKKEYVKSNILTFDYPGVSHGLQISNKFRLIRDKISQKTHGSYNVLIDNLTLNDKAEIYLRTFYRMVDFPDNRYDPVTMPQVYPNDKYIFTVSVEYYFNDKLELTPFVEYSDGSKVYTTKPIVLRNDIREKIELVVANKNNLPICKIGLQLTTKSKSKFGCGLLARFNIHKIAVIKQSKGIIDFSTQENSFCDNVTPFSNSRISTKLSEGKFLIESREKLGLTLTGPYYNKDMRINFTASRLIGDYLGLAFNIKGLENFYYFRIYPEKIELVRHYHLKESILKEWSINTNNKIVATLHTKKDIVSLLIDNIHLITFNNLENEYGHYGFCGQKSKFLVDNIYFEYM